MVLNSTLPGNVAGIIYDRQRLAVLNKHVHYGDNDIRELDIITKLAAEDLNSSNAVLAIVDDQFEWFPSCFGVSMDELPVNGSISAHILAEAGNGAVFIEDLSKDQRFSEHPIVTGDDGAKFFLAVPLIIDNEKLGALCVFDSSLRQDVKEEQIKRLEDLSSLASSVFCLRQKPSKSRQQTHRSTHDDWRKEMAISAAKVYSWVWNLKTNIYDCDDELRRLYRIQHNNPIYASELLDAIDERDASNVRAELENAIVGREDYEAEYRIANSGLWVLSQGKVLERDENGEALRIAGVVVDITVQKKSEEKMELLLRELNHRVKNTLAMLQSIASQTLKNSRSPEDFKQAFSGRIRAIAAAHTLLSDKEWEPVELDGLIRDQVNVYVDNLDRQLIIEGDDVILGPEEALALGMVLHELATNAAKYGALSTPAGRIHIDISLDHSAQPPLVNLSWVERGGPPVEKPDTNGFGSIMIERSLDKIMGSKVTLSFLSDGVEAMIRMPVSSRQRARISQKDTSK